MISIFKKKEKSIQVVTPVTGDMISLKDVPDKVFASGMMGEGVAFKFDSDTLFSPCEGTVIMLPKSLHAVGIKSKNGAELLIHVGLDTVELNGNGFQALVSEGQKIKRGTPILKVDHDYLKENGKNSTTPMVVTNSNEFQVEIAPNQKVNEAETVVMTLS